MMNLKRSVEKIKRRKESKNMQYPFVCPNCGYEEKIDMPMRDYVATGHMCSECNTEMEREVKSLVCMGSVDLTNSFYRRNN